MRKVVLLSIIATVLTASCAKVDSKNMNNTKEASITDKGLETATFASGCFWCMDAAFEEVEGVKKVISGFAGGHVKNPTYEEVASGTTGHLETIQVIYDSHIISYAELLEVYWRQFDPTDDGGSFHDKGSEYLSAIFYHDDVQKLLAEKSKAKLEKSGIFNKPLATKIIKFTEFYPAEEYHQQFCKKNPVRYYSYRAGSGRDEFIKAIWGDLGMEKYHKPSEEELKKKLSDLQYEVTQRMGTERPFQNEYWNNHKEGLYVDVATGQPLFSSNDKFDSGTGWPSFTKPIDPRLVEKRVDASYGMERVEIRSKAGDCHLGHLFDDGPPPTHVRYCMNSASLHFIPKENLEKEGYGDLVWLFK